MKDPAFIAEAAKLQFEVDPLTGEQVQALVALRAAPSRRARARSVAVSRRGANRAAPAEAERRGGSSIAPQRRATRQSSLMSAARP